MVAGDFGQPGTVAPSVITSLEEDADPTSRGPSELLSLLFERRMTDVTPFHLDRSNPNGLINIEPPEVVRKALPGMQRDSSPPHLQWSFGDYSKSIVPASWTSNVGPTSVFRGSPRSGFLFPPSTGTEQ